MASPRTVQRCGFARRALRCGVLGCSLLTVAACSEQEERPPFAPPLEDGTQVYVAPNAPAGAGGPSGAGGAAGAVDAGGSTDAASAAGADAGGSAGFGGGLGGAGGSGIGLDGGIDLIGAGGSRLGGTSGSP